MTYSISRHSESRVLASIQVLNNCFVPSMRLPSVVIHHDVYPHGSPSIILASLSSSTYKTMLIFLYQNTRINLFTTVGKKSPVRILQLTMPVCSPLLNFARSPFRRISHAVGARRVIRGLPVVMGTAETPDSEVSEAAGPSSPHPIDEPTNADRAIKSFIFRF